MYCYSINPVQNNFFLSCILCTSPAHLNHSLNSRSFYAAGAAAAVCCAVTLITADTRASPSPAHRIARAKFTETSEKSREHSPCKVRSMSLFSFAPPYKLRSCNTNLSFKRGNCLFHSLHAANNEKRVERGGEREPGAGLVSQHVSRLDSPGGVCDV